ncbi:MAG: DNA alkylation repair protein [Lewinellaceae bacterium]|nr:DNA alkylation repair protein [Lewinellaceae bacterium]
MHTPSQLIQSHLTALGDEHKARWLENYVKHDIRSKGVGIPQIREVVKAVTKEHGLNQQPVEAQFAILSDLMQQPFTEDKLAAILYLQLYWKGMDARPQLSLISEWFDQRWISDWNVCDWLCVRLLSPMVDRSPEQALPVLKAWNADEYLWTARASLVPFAQCKSITEHIDTIEAFSITLIQREERFCKTSVGWVLREYSRHDKAFVRRFLEMYKEWTTPEVVKNARKYIS